MRVCPAAMSSGWTAGGAASEGRQLLRGCSQPSTVRTHSSGDCPTARSACRPSMRNDTSPIPNSNSKMPNIERMAGTAELATTPQVEREGEESEGGEMPGERGSLAARSASSARLMPRRAIAVGKREIAEKYRGIYGKQPWSQRRDVAKTQHFGWLGVVPCQQTRRQFRPPLFAISKARADRGALIVALGAIAVMPAVVVRRQSLPQPIHRAAWPSRPAQLATVFANKGNRISKKSFGYSTIAEYNSVVA